MNLLFENKLIPSELVDTIISNKILHPFFEIGFEGVKPKNYCGFLNLHSKNYFIVPKISNKDDENLNRFIYMILYAYDIKISNDDIANFENTKFKYLEIFIRHFANILLNEFKKGVFKTYFTKDENLKVLRGKYLIEKNFTNFYHQRIFCEFDEFSMDNQLNQFFLYAIKLFMKYSSCKNLHKCEMVLDEVEYKHINIDRLDIEFNRLNSRYKKSFELAIMILKKLSPVVNSSNSKSFAFLFNMAEVFEKFIGNIYKDIDRSTKLQHQRAFGNLLLKPDIFTQNLIIDTKYKMVKNKDDLATHDKYQMFTYGTNLMIQNTLLLYPKHLYDITENLNLGTEENMVDLKMRSMDLSGDGMDYYEYITEIKNRLEKII